ncbi:MAG TPA: Hsp70 family protein [Candidatus Kryptonia bacterium]|nr:Hsp70 family protein [Candidatus Kryptonia bacterium]
MQRFGLDFGTTNSSLTWARGERDVTLCDLDLRAINPRVLRSLIYFSLDARDFVVGQRAVDEYLAEDMQGTLIQSIKTFLADNSFEQTWINDRFYKLEDLIAVIFRHVRAVIAGLTSEEVSLVIGRPAIFVERPEKEALAQERLRKAAQLAGFFELRFQYEPIAAGLTYESSLTKPELALIADLGGGTSDFTVMRLGSGAAGDRRDDILATRGVQIAGDAFSACIMARKLAKYFGAGSTYRSMEGRPLPFPSMLLAQLSRWHQVTFLRSPKTREQLGRIRWTTNNRRAVDAFETLISGNYAFFLFQEIEKAKSLLSQQDETVIRFRREAVDIDEPITRPEFERLIAADQAQVRRCMESVLAAAGIRASDIDAVFLTGGTAQIPAIRRMFAEQFGESKLKSQDYLTSVAVGLGLSALRDG